MRQALATPDANRAFDAMDRFARSGMELDGFLRMEEASGQPDWWNRVRFRDGDFTTEVNRRIETLKAAQQELARYGNPGQAQAPTSSEP